MSENDIDDIAQANPSHCRIWKPRGRLHSPRDQTATVAAFSVSELVHGSHPRGGLLYKICFRVTKLIGSRARARKNRAHNARARSITY